MEDHANWNISDNYPQEDIGNIFPISERMQSIYARIRDKANLNLSPLNILSVIDMVKALEYHHGNFKNYTADIPADFLERSAADQEKIQNAKFEAIAYINTVGQVHGWLKSSSINMQQPMISEIYTSFRSKYTAHRSIDDPRKETNYEQELHMFVFRSQLWNANKELVFQIQKVAGNTVQLNILIDHQIILREVLDVFQTVVM